jgi:TonB family protein
MMGLGGACIVTRRFNLAPFLFLLFATRVPAQVLPAPASHAPAEYGAIYPDSPVGLQHFVEDLLSAIKAGDNTKVDSLWQSAILPDHTAWFASVFGEKEGTSLEASYAKRLANTPYTPGKAYTFAASLDVVKVLVLPLAQAAVSRPDSWAKAIQLSLKEEVHAYRVEAVSAGSTSSIMLGYFFFVSGGFREVDELVFGSLAATKQSIGLPYISAAQAQMLLLQSTQPVTPHLFAPGGISRTVMLDVIIDVAGQVRSASILSGDIVLGNAARAAVLTWRYRPYIQNGRAVDVETTVTITFPL